MRIVDTSNDEDINKSIGFSLSLIKKFKKELGEETSDVDIFLDALDLYNWELYKKLRKSSKRKR